MDDDGKSKPNSRQNGNSSHNPATHIDLNTARMVLYADDLSRVTVEGHNTSLPADEIKAVYFRYFGSCGNVRDIIIPTDLQTESVFVYFWDQDAQEKAVALSGCNVGFPIPRRKWLGGWDVVVKALPKQSCRYTSDQVDFAHRLLRRRRSRNFQQIGNSSNTEIDFNELTISKAFEDRLIARKIVNTANFRSWFRVAVEGYDTSLREKDVSGVLASHFSSCGKICDIVIPGDIQNKCLAKCGFVYFLDKSAHRQAVALDGLNVGFPYRGIDVGGWDLSVKAAKHQSCKYSHDQVAAARKLESTRSYCFFVTGYPTSLPANDVKTALFRLFSSCGEIRIISAQHDCIIKGRNRPGPLLSSCLMDIAGEGAVEKAMELSGTDMGEWTVLVKPPYASEAKPIKSPSLFDKPSEANPIKSVYGIGWEGPIGLRWVDLHPSAASSSLDGPRTSFLASC